MRAHAPKYNPIHPSSSLFSPPPPPLSSLSWNLGGTQPWDGLWARYLLSLCRFLCLYNRMTPVLSV